MEVEEDHITKLKSLPITRDNIRSFWNFRPFIFDTETTGFYGCPVFHKNHQILQIACIDICSQDEFDEYIDNPDAIIVEQSSKVHGITTEILKSNDAKSPLEVMKKFLLWVYERAGDNLVVFFAHNALFDFFMLLKTLPVDCGKEGKHLKFIVVDTLDIIKFFYPDIKYNAFLPEYQDKICNSKPHCLPSLSRYFFGGNYQNLHNAIVDCRELEKIVMNFILPHVVMDLHGDKSKVKGLIKPRDLYPSTPSMLTKLRDVKYIRGFVKSFLPIVNAIYEKHGMNHLMTTNNLISVFDIYTYGALKHKEDSKTFPISDPWLGIIIQVETLMRTIIGIYTDDIHCELFGLMTNRSSLEFALNTTVEGTDQPLYPSLAGNPVSYLPFIFSPLLSEKLLNELGIRTAHEFYLDFHFSKLPLKKWVNFTLSKLKVNASDAFSEGECEENFKLVVKRFD